MRRFGLKRVACSADALRALPVAAVLLVGAGLRFARRVSDRPNAPGSVRASCVARRRVANHEAVSLAAVEPFDAGALQRAVSARREAWGTQGAGAVDVLAVCAGGRTGAGRRPSSWRSLPGGCVTPMSFPRDLVEVLAESILKSIPEHIRRLRQRDLDVLPIES